MAAVNRLAIYRAHYRQVARACMDLSLGGFLVDGPRREALAREAAREKARLRAELAAHTPFDLFGKGKRKGEVGKGLSALKVAAYFYDVLKCKAYKRRGGGRTCDEDAIRRLMRAYKKARPVGQRVLDWRQWDKREQFLAASRVDEDGVFRALYAPTTVNGQLASSENPLGTGSNAQNLPRPPSPVRSIFIPDRGQVLLEWDFSRIQNRLLGGMSGDRRMMREAMPESTVDTYQDAADDLQLARAFNELFGPTTTDDDSDVMRQPSMRKYYIRQTGKRTLLAAGFGMRGDMMSHAILLETEGALVLAPAQCQRWLDRLYEIRPGIPKYQAWVREPMLRKGYLENTWGRRLYFRVLRLTDAHFRDGYAWRVASEDRMNTNQLGFLPARALFRREKIPGRVVQQGHDALAATVPVEVAYDVLRTVGQSMNRTRTYPGAGGEWELACPIGYKLGPHWGGMQEWKVLPSRSEFAAALERVVGQVWWRTRRTMA